MTRHAIVMGLLVGLLVGTLHAAGTAAKGTVTEKSTKGKSAAETAEAPTAQAESEPTPDPVVLKARSEPQQLRSAWDKARLEVTVYDKRYRRAYERWVKATKDTKASAMKRRDQAMVEFKISLERRRLAWYEWELGKAKQVALEADTKAKGLREDVARVKKRIEALGGSWKPTPVPTKVP